MATYDSLSEQDKAVVQNAVNLIRAESGSVARAFNVILAIEADTNATSLIQSIDAGETIPNTSGLAGADDMTRAEIVAIWNDFLTMKTSHDTAGNRAAWSKAAGINALINE